MKVKVWLEIDSKLAKSAPNARVLASSSSAIVPSKISEGMTRRDIFLVAHPVNPPYLTPMVEVVPAPWTGEEARTAARYKQYSTRSLLYKREAIRDKFCH